MNKKYWKISAKTLGIVPFTNITFTASPQNRSKGERGGIKILFLRAIKY